MFSLKTSVCSTLCFQIIHVLVSCRVLSLRQSSLRVCDLAEQHLAGRRPVGHRSSWSLRQSVSHSLHQHQSLQPSGNITPSFCLSHYSISVQFSLDCRGGSSSVSANLCQNKLLWVRCPVTSLVLVLQAAMFTWWLLRKQRKYIILISTSNFNYIMS